MGTDGDLKAWVEEEAPNLQVPKFRVEVFKLWLLRPTGLTCGLSYEMGELGDLLSILPDTYYKVSPWMVELA